MDKRARSVPRAGKYFAVASSPFNVVKLALGVIIVAGVLMILVTGRLAESPLMQILLLAGYGVFAALWLILKTRQVMRAHAVTFDEKSSVNNELQK